MVPWLDFTAGTERGLVDPAMSLERDVPLLEHLGRQYPGGLVRVQGLAQPRRLPYLQAQGLDAAYRHTILDERVDSSDRDAYRDIQRGRKVWAHVGAWPWACYGPNGRPPRRWWEDELAVAAWWHWVDP